MAHSNSFRNTFLFTLLAALAISAAFFSGFLTGYRQKTDAELPVLHQAYDILLSKGYRTPPANPALEYGMIRGMLEAYGDPFTSFFEPAQHELTSNSLEGKFGGIGVNLGRDAENYYILFPIPDNPAAKAGIQEGDRLIAVDQLDIQPSSTIENVQAALRGKVGEKVKVVIARPPDYNRLEFSIKREEIQLPSVTSHLDPLEPRLGVIQVNIMASTTPKELTEAIQGLQSRGAQGFALDLRNNFGGLLDSGIDSARLFLKDGIVMEQQYKNQPVESFKVEKPGKFTDIQMVVLINHNTASAAEILAGAIQAHHRALLIGIPSYGKDTIQLVFELQDKSSLQVTAAHWWNPGLGNDQTGKGLQPDVPVDETTTDGIDPLMQKAIDTLFGK